MKKRGARRRSRSVASSPSTPSSPSWHAGPPFALVVLVLQIAALVLYWGSLRNPLVFDDVHNLRDHVARAFHAETEWRFGLRWISDASFWLIFKLFGKDLLWQRLANVLLHAGTAALLYGFLARLFHVVLDDPRSKWLALSGALLFLLHPVAVYGVAYLIERSIILATLFSVLALWCVLEGSLKRSAGWDAAAAMAYLLAVFSKEHAVMLPAVAAALIVLVHGATLEQARRAARVFVLFAAIGATVILMSSGRIGAAYEPFASDAFSSLSARGGFDAGLAYPISVQNQALLFFRYLLTWLVPWPGWMSIDVRTAFPQQLLGWPHSAAFVAWLAYGAVAAWLILKRGRLGLLGFGLLFPWLLALTEVAVVRAQEPFVLYRSYLWMCGLPAIVPAVVTVIAGGLASRWRVGVAAAICLLLVAGARDRLDTFSSPLRLWDDVVSKNTDPGAPYVERAYLARGHVHFDAGRLETASADFERALELNPRLADAYVARGSVRLARTELKEALEDMDRAIALDPGYASAYDKRCAVKIGLRRPQDAAADCEKAVTLDPKNIEAWINTGVLYHRWLGRTNDAARSYERALALDPEHGVANFNYGMLLAETGRRDEAVRNHIVIGCNAGIQIACDVLNRSRRGL